MEIGGRGGGGLETGGRGGGRVGGVIRGGQEGSWEDFTAGGGGLGRHGRNGGLEEGREGGGERGEDGGMEAGEGMDGVSSGPVRGLVWLWRKKGQRSEMEITCRGFVYMLPPETSIWSPGLDSFSVCAP